MGAISRIARRLAPLFAATALLMAGMADPLLHLSGFATYVAGAAAKDGHGGSGKGGDGSGKGGDSGSDHDGDSGSDSGKGSDDGGRGDGDGGDDNGKSSRDHRDKDARKEARDVQRYMNMVSKRGTVTWSRVGPGAAELRYSDGWSESVKAGRYSLRDKANRVVTERPAKAADLSRLSKAAGSR